MREGDRLCHVRNGTVGVAIERDGQWLVRHKQGHGMVDEVYDPEAWRPEAAEQKPPNQGQRAMVAFEADQAFCKVMGRYGLKRMWASLTREEMRRWMDPDNPPIPEYTVDSTGDKSSQQDRRRLYLFVHRAMMPKRERKSGED